MPPLQEAGRVSFFARFSTCQGCWSIALFLQEAVRASKVFRYVPWKQLVDTTALSRFNDQHNFNLTEEAMSFVRARLEEAGLSFWDAAQQEEPRASTPFLAT